MLIGIAIGVGVLLLLGFLFMGGSSDGGPSFPPGSRAFEAELNLPLIEQAQSARIEILEEVDDPIIIEQLEAELEELELMMEDCLDAIRSGDLSPGRGYIGVDMPITPDI